MKKIKLVIVGCAGRMGKQLIKEMQNFKNIDLLAAIEKKNSPSINKNIKKIKITSDKEEAFRKADAIIDFSLPESTLETVKYATKLKKKLVIGTTGLNSKQISQIKNASKKTAIVFAPNMSIGINLMIKLVDEASNILFNNNTSVEILDIHHKNKKDAPSGTALALANAVVKAKNFNLKKKSTMKPNKKRKKQLGKINFYCKRQGSIVGDHSVIFTNNGEEIELKHRGFNRSIYAIGAIRAAIWVHHKKKGFFNMSNVLGIS
jgi:4-hydroxy-tetrahydrodipicolinate reductase